MYSETKCFKPMGCEHTGLYVSGKNVSITMNFTPRLMGMYYWSYMQKVGEVFYIIWQKEKTPVYKLGFQF